MVQVFYSQKSEQLIKKLELAPEARLLGHDFSAVIQNVENEATVEVIEIIEKLLTIWRD
jgi:hypothetical protein